MEEKKFENKLFEFLGRMKNEAKRLSEFTKLELKIIALKHKKDKQLNNLGNYLYEKACKGGKDFSADTIFDGYIEKITDLEKNISKVKKEIEKIKTGQ